MVKELKAELEGLNRCVRCAARTSSAVVVGGVRPARRVSLLRLRPVPSPSHKHAATGFRQDLEECRDKISGVEDKIQVLNDEIDREQAVGREAQDAITRIDDFQLQLEQKRSHMVTQEAGETPQARFAVDVCALRRSVTTRRSFFRQCSTNRRIFSARTI